LVRPTTPEHQHPRVSESSLRRTDANPTAKGQSQNSGKQPAGLKLTSGSGEQAHYEVPLLANRRKKNLYLIDTVGNYIMGFIKPID